MDQTMQQLISQYGYWLMAFGALAEGESFLIAGGIAAKHGLLSIPGLIALAWLGSTVHDCFFFFLGRYAGQWLLRKRPNWNAKIRRVDKVIDRYGSWTVIIMRFLYGIRMIIPTALGMTPMKTSKFIIFDIIGGGIWSTVFVVGGYLFGEVLDVLLHQLSQYENWIGELLILFLIICGVIFFIWLWRRKRKS